MVANATVDRSGRTPMGRAAAALCDANSRVSDDAEIQAWSLIEAAQAGDGQAFARLYELYEPRVRRYLAQRLGDHALAEDLTSETFLRALRRVDSLRDKGRSVGGWFITIARNLAIDYHRSGRFRTEWLRAEPPDVRAYQPGPEEVVIAEFSHGELRKCLAKLRTDQQTCLALRYFDGLSIAETAAMMNRTKGAVKALQRRAVLSLSDLLPAAVR